MPRCPDTCCAGSGELLLLPECSRGQEASALFFWWRLCARDFREATHRKYLRPRWSVTLPQGPRSPQCARFPRAVPPRVSVVLPPCLPRGLCIHGPVLNPGLKLPQGSFQTAQSAGSVPRLRPGGAQCSPKLKIPAHWEDARRGSWTVCATLCRDLAFTCMLSAASLCLLLTPSVLVTQPHMPRTNINFIDCRRDEMQRANQRSSLCAKNCHQWSNLGSLTPNPSDATFLFTFALNKLALLCERCWGVWGKEDDALAACKS